jgi:hypothetical protein
VALRVGRDIHSQEGYSHLEDGSATWPSELGEHFPLHGCRLKIAQHGAEAQRLVTALQPFHDERHELRHAARDDLLHEGGACERVH